jgi:tetratricopeptide (TPR) repeat protein
MATTEDASCPRFGARRSAGGSPVFCPRRLRENSRDVPQHRLRILSPVAIAALMMTTRIVTAACPRCDATQNCETIVSHVGDAGAHIKLGNAVVDLGKLAPVVAECGGAIRLKPNYADAHFNLGVVLRAQGNLKQAFTELRKARDNAQPGSKVAQQIERALTAIGR